MNQILQTLERERERDPKTAAQVYVRYNIYTCDKAIIWRLVDSSKELNYVAMTERAQHLSLATERERERQTQRQRGERETERERRRELGQYKSLMGYLTLQL